MVFIKYNNRRCTSSIIGFTNVQHGMQCLSAIILLYYRIMKKIIITGKKTVDDLTIQKSKRQRMCAKRYENDIESIEQLEIIRNLYHKVDDIHGEIARIEIERKINGYKQQDIKKGIYDCNKLISLYETLEKLVESKLVCHYCKKQVKVLYRIVREPKQWTLDRINNDLGHSNSNTLISCLSCNLKRRMIDKDKFEFTKQLHITKKGCSEIQPYEIVEIEK